MSETFNLISSRKISKDEIDGFLLSIGFVSDSMNGDEDRPTYKLVEGDSQIEVIFYESYFDDPFLDIEDQNEKARIKKVTEILGGQPKATIAIDYNSGLNTEKLYLKLVLEFEKKWNCVLLTSLKIYDRNEVRERYSQLT